MRNILIGTDVILDFFFDRKPFSDNSAIILSQCESNKINGFITPVICTYKAGDIEVILTRNSQDYSKSRLGIMTPEDFIKIFNANRL